MNIPRNKRFFEHGEWIDLLGDAKNYHDLDEANRKRFIRESMEDGYRREYYSALEFMNEKGPDWEDLTDEQRENIRNEQREHAQAMQNFGKAIASGSTEEIDTTGKKLAGI